MYANEAEVRRISEAIANHPAAQMRGRATVILRSLTAVFMPNGRELLHLLEAASQDDNLAIELIQNVRPPDVRERFERLLTQRLQNYLASNGALIDHTRNVVRELDPNSDLVLEFERRKQQIASEVEVEFVKQLRNYTLHRSLPFIGHEVSFAMGDRGQEFDSEVSLSRDELLEWDKWNSGPRGYLEALQEDHLKLRPLVRRHFELMCDLHGWLFDALEGLVAPGIPEINELIVELQAARSGITIEEARVAVDQQSRRVGRGAFRYGADE